MRLSARSGPRPCEPSTLRVASSAIPAWVSVIAVSGSPGAVIAAPLSERGFAGTLIPSASRSDCFTV